MFDILVVALLLALSVLAARRLPTEGRITGRSRSAAPVITITCGACRATLHGDETSCGTCGRSLT